MAKKTKEVISYFEDLYKNGAIYLWGANGQVITKELCDKLYATYGTSTYNKTYYNNKLKEGQGKIGADCSGAMYAMSGFDTTAQGYYDKCTTKGTISGINKSKPCLVFRKSGSKMNHIGFYCGNGYTIEMQSSKTNCVKKSLSSGTWTHYGIPSWIDYSDWNSNSNTTTSTTNIKGIDVSSYQGNIDWKKVAADGVKFVILRGTLKNGTMDTTFEKNYKGATENGLDVAVYHFSYALNSNTAINDAINLVNKLNGKKIPIWLDLEWSTQGKLGKAKISEIAVAFVQACKNLGYECHIYSNLDWYKNYYEPTILASIGCKFWIARYGANNGKYEEKYKPNVGEYIWQYTSKGSVNGISGNVDMNMKFETGSSNSSNNGSSSDNNNSSTAITSIQKMVKIICKNGVNRRTSPNSSISSNKIGVYKYGTTVEVVGITQNKSWYKDTTGNYFTANTEWVTDLTGKVYNCSKLNLRSTATSATNNNIVTVLDVNDKVNILKKSGKWYYVETEKGIKGYVSGSYIKLN